ncbi:hypothetical protein KRX51_03190 [Corynebacterium sp. TAE3-ERU12]|uniref:hypothetical protein n=1 Tax=Corynebacterium sp. TAE3-ERU12 TaxID=2849491 RepID=UPI001C43DCF4|nr:hypothetical protein [Corynebacterium sp. TAE3-ERU12]MBV7294923.1 hypothetical protein [Corynebacterium sp. TAE3-ERU12]
MDPSTTPDSADSADETTGREETQANSTDSEASPSDKNSEMSLEDYKKELDKVRREAARYRTQRNELRPLADKARAAEEATKTEQEKAQERIAALEAENQRIVLDTARTKAASEHNVPADLVHGATAEDIEQHAQALRALIDTERKAAIEEAIPHAPRVPGENAGNTPVIDDNNWLRDALRGR